MAFIILLGRGFDLRLSGLSDFNALETRMPVSAETNEDPVLVLPHSIKLSLWVGPQRSCKGNMGLGIVVIDICITSVLASSDTNVTGELIE